MTLRKLWLSQRMVDSMCALGAREAPVWQGVEIVADPFLPHGWALYEYADGTMEMARIEREAKG
jgi:hypothetical protein